MLLLNQGQEPANPQLPSEDEVGSHLQGWGWIVVRPRFTNTVPAKSNEKLEAEPPGSVLQRMSRYTSKVNAMTIHPAALVTEL